MLHHEVLRVQGVWPANELLARQGSDALSIPGAGRKICSSVMLQQLLLYNIYAGMAWLVFVFVRALQNVRRVPDGGVQRMLASTQYQCHPPLAMPPRRPEHTADPIARPPPPAAVQQWAEHPGP